MTNRDSLPELPTSLQELRLFLDQMETQRLEFKSASDLNDPTKRDKARKDLGRQVSAFANAEGGLLLVGMGEQSRKGMGSVATHIEGVESAVWKPLQFQQMILDSTRPIVGGIKVKPIALESQREAFAYAVLVPPGTTCYQAPDCVYYVRYELECRPLPDNEVRLRMFRTQSCQAIVRVENARGKVIRKLISTMTDGASQAYREYLSKNLLIPNPDLEWPVDTITFDLAIENSGLRTIFGFNFQIGNDIAIPNYVRAIELRDGRPALFGGVPANANEAVQMSLYPGLAIRVPTMNYQWAFERPQRGQSWWPGDELCWTLYLEDRPPIEGEVNIQALWETIENDSR